jgi:ELWxxDGT repeat protein
VFAGLGVFFGDAVEGYGREARGEAHERGPDAAVDEGHFVIDQSCDEDVAGIAEVAGDAEDFATSPPRGSLGSLAWMWPSRGPSGYFLADDGDGADLWTTDGTNTRVVPGVPEINRAEWMAQLGSTVIFSVRQKLYATGGGAPVELATFSSTSIEGQAIYKNELYFTATQSGTGNEMWKTDGTPGGTTVVDVNPGPVGSDTYGYAASGDWLYFFGKTPAGQGLHRTDGTVSGTTRVGSVDSIDPATVSLGNGSLLFFTVGCTMWRSDGTAAGTFALGETDPVVCDTTSLASIGNDLYWLTGTSLWRSDGSTAGTTRVATFSRTGCENALVAHDRRLYFAAETTSAGDELWTSDGTSGGTRLLADIEPGPVSSIPRELTVAGNRIFFAATTRDAGRELFAYDVAKSGKSRAVRH